MIDGFLRVDPVLRPEHLAYLVAFHHTLRLKRDAAKLLERLQSGEFRDELRTAVGLPIGPDGGYFVGGSGSIGQAPTADVFDFNTPPSGQPTTHCPWTPTARGDYISAEPRRFSDAQHGLAWLSYIVDNFLAPWGYSVYGEARWDHSGEYDDDDRGTIFASGSRVAAVADVIIRGRPPWEESA